MSVLLNEEQRRLYGNTSEKKYHCGNDCIFNIVPEQHRACLSEERHGRIFREYIIVFSRGITWEEAAQEVASWGTHTIWQPLQARKSKNTLLNSLMGFEVSFGSVDTISQKVNGSGQPASLGHIQTRILSFPISI
jgi:hypothetical protein